MHETALEQVRGGRRGLGVFLVRAGQGAVLAVAQEGVRAVPVLHDLEPTVDLPAQAGAGRIAAREDRAHRASQFFEGLAVPAQAASRFSGQSANGARQADRVSARRSA